MKNNLSKDDLEIINRMYGVIISIRNIYDKLIELEINNLKDSVEFKKNIEYLLIAREIEYDILYSIDNDKIMNYLNYLSKDLDLQKNSINYILDGDYKSIDTLRFIEELLMIFNYKNKNTIDVENAISDDILNTFLYYLKHNYSITNDKVYMKSLMVRYYYTIFTFKTLEVELIYDKFNVNKKTTDRARHVAKLLGYGDEKYNYEKNDILSSLMIENMKKILDATDNDYKNPSILMMNYVRLLLISSCLKNSPSFIQKNMKISFNHYLDFNKNVDNEISKKLVKSLYNIIEK